MSRILYFFSINMQIKTHELQAHLNKYTRKTGHHAQQRVERENLDDADLLPCFRRSENQH